MPDYIRNFVLLQETFQLESIGQNLKSLQHLRYVTLLYFGVGYRVYKIFFFFMVFIKIGTTYLKNIGGAMYANALNSNPLRPPSAGMYTVRLTQGPDHMNIRPSLHTDFHSYAHL